MNQSGPRVEVQLENFGGRKWGAHAQSVSRRARGLRPLLHDTRSWPTLAQFGPKRTHSEVYLLVNVIGINKVSCCEVSTDCWGVSLFLPITFFISFRVFRISLLTVFFSYFAKISIFHNITHVCMDLVLYIITILIIY